jgi:hypothetical protein
MTIIWTLAFILMFALVFGVVIYCINKIPPNSCNGNCYQGRQCDCKVQ